MRSDLEVMKLILNAVEVDKDGCWLWLKCSSISKGGSRYGAMSFRGRPEGVHRVSYTLFVGDIPKGLTIDHICRKTLCVNPNHLRPMTARENILIGNSIIAQNNRKTHCKQGHDFSITARPRKSSIGNPGRACRACMTIRQKIKRAKRRAI